MSEQSAKSERYAQAILDAVLEQWQTALTQISDALAKNDELRSMLESPQQNSQAKMKALQGVMPKGVSPEIQNFLNLLAQEGDLDQIPAVLKAMRGGMSGQAEPLKADVTSAVELGEQERDEVRRRLLDEYGEGLIFSFRVDPSLLGGLRVRVGDMLIDHTVASRLAELREIVSASVR
jgi:F-type H+-transporting ATPase subunit delta